MRFVVLVTLGFWEWETYQSLFHLDVGEFEASKSQFFWMIFIRLIVWIFYLRSWLYSRIDSSYRIRYPLSRLTFWSSWFWIWSGAPWSCPFTTWRVLFSNSISRNWYSCLWLGRSRTMNLSWSSHTQIWIEPRIWQRCRFGKSWSRWRLKGIGIWLRIWNFLKSFIILRRLNSYTRQS